MGKLTRGDIVIFVILTFLLISAALWLILFFPATNLSNLNTNLGTKF